MISVKKVLHKLWLPLTAKRLGSNDSGLFLCLPRRKAATHNSFPENFVAWSGSQRGLNLRKRWLEILLSSQGRAHG